MPELPEVETVCRGLTASLGSSAVIKDVEFLRLNLRSELPHQKKHLLLGQQILSVQRRAKYILMKTTGASILSHLGMTGNWRVASEKNLEKHDHISIQLADLRYLIYRDPRRFGYFDIFQGESHEKLDLLGPEPLEESFSDVYFFEQLQQKSLPIKASIMDQAVVVGVGNIYASEALFLSGISPLKSSLRLKKEEVRLLRKNIRIVLEKAILAGGSTIQNFASADGSSGYFQHQFQVYGRAGMPCLSCHSAKIKSKLISGRNTFWCPQCQNSKKILVVKLKKV